MRPRRVTHGIGRRRSREAGRDARRRLARWRGRRHERDVHRSLGDSLETSDTLPHSIVKDVERQFGARSVRRTTPAFGTSIPNDRPTVVELFWSKGVPESCRYRLSVTESNWIERAGGSYDARTCGGLP